MAVLEPRAIEKLPRQPDKIWPGFLQLIYDQSGITLWTVAILALIVAILFGLIWLFCCYPPQPSNDEVHFTNGGTGENAILVDAASGSPPWNDHDFMGPGGSNISLGANVTGTGEIIAFAHGWRPTLREHVDWKDSTTRVDFTFENELAIPIDIWILKSLHPYDPENVADYAQPNHARLSVSDTNAIWESEAAGLVLDPGGSTFGNIHNATEDPDAAPEAYPDLLHFTCDHATTTVYDRNGDPSPNAENIQHKIGYTPNRINVYIVDSVYGSVSAGVHCGEIALDQQWGLIALGHLHSSHLLAHEIGHALSLGHVNDRIAGTTLPGFDGQNVMHSDTPTRRFLTEGQTFRQVLDPLSAVARVYNARQPLSPERAGVDCPSFLAAHIDHPRYNVCPTLGRRLRADNGMGPGP